MGNDEQPGNSSSANGERVDENNRSIEDNPADDNGRGSFHDGEVGQCSEDRVGMKLKREKAMKAMKATKKVAV